MLSHITRFSFWMAGLAAIGSLVVPGRDGALMLVTVAVLSLIAALWLRRSETQVEPVPLPDPLAFDDATMMEIATTAAAEIGGATDLSDAMARAAELIRVEFGARGLRVLRLDANALPPRPDALLARALQGTLAIGADGGFALPVMRDRQVVAVLSAEAVELAIACAPFGRLLGLIRAQLEAGARRNAAGPMANPVPAPVARQVDKSPEPTPPADVSPDPDDSPIERRPGPPPEHRSPTSQDRLAEFTRTTGECMFITDPERSHFELIGGDPLDVFGREADQVMADSESVLPEDRHLLAERYRAEMSGEPVDVTMRVAHPQKGQRWLRTRTRTVVLADGRRVVHGVTVDATEARLREFELERARDEAQAASRAKSQFMANMSHEIRTPMNGILGMTELLLSTTLDERQKRFAKAVYRSGESLLEIINDILDFSKIEAGKLELARTDFSLRALIEDTLELLAPRAHEKGLELSFQETHDVPTWVQGDPLRLRQVLTNLIANAIKFTEHGEVVIAVARDTAPGGSLDRLRFSVRDTGIGIDNDVLPKLFSAFMQANGGMSRRYGGTGLGLAISRQLIELMGGRIEVTSQPGVGSKFEFSLPFDVADSQAAGLDFDAAEMPGLRVLVVEDHETNRVVLENMLDAWGMTVTLVEDGQAALDLLSATDAPVFDLALVDMHMPRLDGMALAQALKDGGIAPAMKMILLSSVSSPDDVRAAQEVGFHRFVAKPIRKSELRQAIAGASASLREKPSVAPLLSGHVLVIEDNPVNQEVIGQMLRQMGLQVRVASGALRGLRAMCEAHFDLVLMDIQMPGMDGVEALGWLRRGSGDRFQFVTPSAVPVIAVTANALGGDEERFLSLGFDDYLSKPFRQAQLLAMLTHRLGAQRAVVRAPDKGPDQGLPRMPAPFSPSNSASTPISAMASPSTVTAPVPAMPPAIGETVLDAGALARLRELDPRNESQLLARIVKAFETSAGRFLPQVAEARRLGDLDGIRLVAHTLKSSAASVGALKLSTLCGEIENMIRLGQTDGLDPRVDAMVIEIEIVLQALKRMLDGRP